MKRKVRLFALACCFLALFAASMTARAETGNPGLGPALLDALAAGAYQPSLLVAFGTFTFAEDNLSSPFSRYLEERLSASMLGSKRLRLFNRAVAAAMDPALREIYGDFFKENSVDALLAGRYYDEGEAIRVHLELTGLSTGELFGAEDLSLSKAELPPNMEVLPGAEALDRAKSLGRLLGAPGKGELSVSVATERGSGAVYREGELLSILVAVNKEAWAKVYHIDVNGEVQLIWPNRFDSGRKLEPGQPIRIPAEGSSFEFKMTRPFGTEFIKVLASTQPFSNTEEDFASLGRDSRATLTRGLKLQAAAAGAEQAEALASYVITGAR